MSVSVYSNFLAIKRFHDRSTSQQLSDPKTKPEIKFQAVNKDFHQLHKTGPPNLEMEAEIPNSYWLLNIAIYKKIK